MSHYISLNRRFWPVEADKQNDPETIRALSAFGLAQEVSWDNLLEKHRVVILAEPGTGKTEELRAAAKRLRAAGKPAFFCRIELLQSLDVHRTFDIGTSVEFAEWMTGNHEGWFFLDSVDEAKLSSRSAFEIGLRHFADTLGEALSRARVIVTCRVSNWRATADLSMFLSYLPIPQIASEQETEGTASEDDKLDFAFRVGFGQTLSQEKKEDHVVLQLLPLNDEQIRRFAAEKDVGNTNDFIEAIERSDAMIFAERPQDLLELIAFWKSNGRLGQHAEMLEFNIKVKLAEHDPDRDERRPLSSDDAVFGATCIAAASSLGKKSSVILPDHPIDMDLRNASIEPKEVLPAWSSDKIQTLLDRAIFDEAIYGTVQFHHRSIREYLTAAWLRRLLEQGKSLRSVKGLIFAKRYGCEVVIPSMRPAAAWLAIWDERVRDRIRAVAPEVLIENGDPSNLPAEFRKSLLVGFAEAYADRQYTGPSFDISMIRRLADPALGPTVKELLTRFVTHNDICTVLLELIWQGQISDCVKVACSCAVDNRVSDYARICAIRAVKAAGNSEQHQHLLNALLAEISSLSPNIIAEICESFFPESLSVEQFLEIVKAVKPPEPFTASPIMVAMDTIAKGSFPEETNKNLLWGLHRLLKTPPYIEIEWHDCEVSERYKWLLPSTIRLTNQLLRKKHPFAFDPMVLDLFLSLLVTYDYHQFLSSEREEILKAAEGWPEFQRQLFWYATAAARTHEDKEGRLTEWWQISWCMKNLWVPGSDDLEQLFVAMRHRPLMDDRLVALSAIFHIYAQTGRPRALRERMKTAVRQTPQLKARLQELFHPKPLSDEQRKWRQRGRAYKRRQLRREKKRQANREEWRLELKKNPEGVKDVGNADRDEVWKGTAYLYNRLREKSKRDVHLGHSDWRALIDEFGYEVAKNFRDGCVAYWRQYDPFTYPDRRTRTPLSFRIGLTGLAMEAADDPEFTKNLKPCEAIIAAHYSVCEMNGFPTWFRQLYTEFPDQVDKVIINELRWELHREQAENAYRHTLSALKHTDTKFSSRYRQVLCELLSEKDPTNDLMLNDILSLLLQGDIHTFFQQEFANLACVRFKDTPNMGRKLTWLIAVLFVDGTRGMELLKEWVAAMSSEEERKEMMINFCSALTHYGERRFHCIIRDYERTGVLSELLHLIYRFVKVEEDHRHEGPYSPDKRDDAERTRSHLSHVLANTPGRPSYEALINLSTSISNRYAKDRMHYLAKERAALDAEFEAWSGADIAEFTLSAERPPQESGRAL